MIGATGKEHEASGGASAAAMSATVTCTAVAQALFLAR